MTDFGEFAQTMLTLDGNSYFAQFRTDRPALANYTLKHAFAIYMANRSLWATPSEFVANYINVVERNDNPLKGAYTEEYRKMDKAYRWRKHAELVRSWMIGG